MKAAPQEQTVDSAQGPTGGPTGTRRADIRGRFAVEKPYPMAGAPQGFTRAMDRNWDVQVFTGRAVSTQDKGRWGRGQLVRMFQPTVELPPQMTMFDRTRPETWHQAQR